MSFPASPAKAASTDIIDAMTALFFNLCILHLFYVKYSQLIDYYRTIAHPKQLPFFGNAAPMGVIKSAKYEIAGQIRRAACALSTEGP